MDIKDLGRDDGIIVNTQEEWNKLLELSGCSLFKEDFNRYDSIIMYPTDNTLSDKRSALEKGYLLYQFSDFINIEPQYEIY